VLKILKLSKTLKSINLRYLFVGAWNTAFGYFLANTLYYTLHYKYHLLVIAIFSNIMSITMSFLSYKIIVFKTSGNWLSEYRRFYILYGANTILGTALLWVLIDFMGIRFWIGQAIVIFMSIILLYIGHLKYTFVNAGLTK
jgi:putative flippase GtrA